MSARVSVFIATSLDGFIARKDGSLDWLDAANETVPPGEDCGYREFMQSVDALVMGRNTFEKVLSFGDWPYGDTAVTVLSRNPISLPDSLPSTVKHSSEDPQTLCKRLSNEGVKHIYVDGGITIQRFLAVGLVDDILITVIPVLLGEGIPLFGPLAQDIPLKHTGTKTFDFGFVQLQYDVNRNA
jgi:dihydrofolate reductase